MLIEKVCLLGSSSGRNAGDAALIAGIMDAIDEECNAKLLYEIPTIKPSFIWNTYKNRVRPISMLPWSLSVKMLGIPTYQSINRCDISLIFDAILFDRSLYNPLFNHMSTLRYFLPQAKKKGRILGMYDVGAGPVNTPKGQAMLRELCEFMDFIAVRDEGSANIMKKIGVPDNKYFVTADAALNVISPPKQYVDKLIDNIGIGEKFLGFNVSIYLDSWSGTSVKKTMSKEDFVKIYSEMIIRVASETNLPVLLIATQFDDEPLSYEIARSIPKSIKTAVVSNKTLTPFEIKGILGRCELLFAMRLHAVILASSELAPVCALPHQPKVNHYLESLGLGWAATSFEKFTVDELTNHVLECYQKREEIKKILIVEIPIAKERAKLPAKIIARLQKGGSIEDGLIKEVLNEKKVVNS